MLGEDPIEIQSIIDLIDKKIAQEDKVLKILSKGNFPFRNTENAFDAISKLEEAKKILEQLL